MEPNAILAINSLDRYNASQGGNGQPASFAQSIEKQYNKTGQPCNNFQVGGFGALIYGYIKKIQVSQIQLQYNVPTIIPGQNDQLMMSLIKLTAPYTITTDLIKIPFGYSTPEELAAILQLLLTTSALWAVSAINVSYRSDYNDFRFEVVDGLTYHLYFPNIDQIKLNLGPSLSNQYLIVLKTYKVFGIDINNDVPYAIQYSGVNADFLYTPYVDIFSTALTKYQKVKDNTTNASSETSIIARIYLAGVAGPQNAGGEGILQDFPSGQPVPITNFSYPLGSRPFIVTQDCNTPKVIRWSKDETVYALDFQLRDQYGDLLFTQFNGGQLTPNPTDNPNPIFYTEFQMTLLCIEGEK